MEPSPYYLAKRSVPRFDPDCDDAASVLLYYRNKAIHWLHAGLVWAGDIEPLCDGADAPWGFHTTFRSTQYVAEGRETHSVYVLRSHRGKGHMARWLAEHRDACMITDDGCGLEGYFVKRGLVKGEAFEVGPAQSSAYDPEYSLVAGFYRDVVADRTGCHMINHVDEGVWILQRTGASDAAIRAFIIHPLTQGDAELKQFYEANLAAKLSSPEVMFLALEYRNIANAHLSWHPAGKDAPFSKSPLAEVNAMLVADKVQNRKDFELFHLGTHPRSDRLLEYFMEWMAKLGLSEERYQELAGELIERTGGVAGAKRQAEVVGEMERTMDETQQPGYVQVHGGITNE